MAKTNDSTNRESLLKIANLVRPALASQPYIPSLTHIRFDRETAAAFNDVLAICVTCDLDVEACIPGDYFIRALGSFNGESVALQYNKEGNLVISSGRSKLKMPTLGLETFPLRIPASDDARAELDITDDLLAGMKLCLMSVGTDPTKPAAMGITLDIDDNGKAVLFSTDAHTISRFQTDTKVKLPGDTPIILPTIFCEQIVKLAASFDKDTTLELHDGAIVARIGREAEVFSKVMVDLDPLDFPRVLSRHVNLEKLHKELVEIPPGFDEALARHELVMSAMTDKSTKLTVEDGMLLMHSESEHGHADDRFKIDASDSERFVDPGDLARCLRVCTHLALLPDVVVMADSKERFVHTISHVDPKQQK